MVDFLRKWTNVILFLIFFLALFLRIHSLSTTPSGFHQDEVVNAYVGRFILAHGVDLYGNHWPLMYFDKHGDFPPVIPMYISALGTYLFGFTQLGARILIAIIGALVIFPMFFIIRKIFRSGQLALLGSLMIAVTPWHVSFSRIGSEGIIAVTVFMYGLWLFFTALSKKNLAFLITSLLLFCSTYFIYPSFRITVPFVLLAAVFIYKKNSFRYVLIGAAVIALLSTLYISTTQWGKGRYEQTSLVNKFSGTNNPMNQFIFNENNVLVARIFNNKAVYVGREFIAEYMSYFSPDFLFTRGGKPDWFDVPNTGLFYLAYALLLLPLFLPFLYRKNPDFQWRDFTFILAILFIAPVASALTVEFTPNTHRSILMSAMFIFLFVYGFSLLQNFKFKKTATSLFFGIFLIEFIFFYHNYFQHVSMYTSVLRGDGNRQTVEYLQQNRNKYDRVYMMASGWFPVYYLYFTHNLDAGLIGRFKANLRTDQVDNVKFIETDCPIPNYFAGINSTEKVLVVVNSGCDFSKFKMFGKIAAISGADRVPIYNIYEK